MYLLVNKNKTKNYLALLFCDKNMFLTVFRVDKLTNLILNWQNQKSTNTAKV